MRGSPRPWEILKRKIVWADAQIWGVPWGGEFVHLGPRAIFLGRTIWQPTCAFPGCANKKMGPARGRALVWGDTYLCSCRRAGSAAKVLLYCLGVYYLALQVNGDVLEGRLGARPGDGLPGDVRQPGAAGHLHMDHGQAV